MSAAVTLEALARARFHDRALTAAEIELLRSAPIGDIAFCGPSRDFDDPLNDPDKAEEWGEERHIHAAIIRWICVNRRAKEFVDPCGLQVFGAKVRDALNFFHVTVPFPLSLRRCRLQSDWNLCAADLPTLDLQGSRVQSIGADGMIVRGSVFLRNDFHAVREVRLGRAKIGGDLDCRNARFLNPFQERTPGTGMALTADGAVVGGRVAFEGNFHAMGHVSLRGTRISGQLSCVGGRFENPASEQIAQPMSGIALDASIATIEGGIFLCGGFRSHGEVVLTAAQIGAGLECTSGIFNNPLRAGIDCTGFALSMDNATVNGSVILRDGFHAEGEVRLLGAHVEGDLDCVGGTFHNPRPQDGETTSHALSAHSTVIRKNALLRDVLADGEVSFQGAQIAGNLECDGSAFHGDLNLESASVGGSLLLAGVVNPGLLKLDFINASVGALADEEASWPMSGNLNLEGFVYERFSRGAPRGAKRRLDWLALQKGFIPQPYRQLAKVFRDEGDDAGARRVLCEMERIRHDKGDRSRVQRLWSLVLKLTIGYGYHPVWALWWLLGLMLLGSVLYLGGYSVGSIVPTDKDAYSAFKEDHHALPPDYERFHVAMYSLENSFPLVKLGQADRWQPDPTPQHFAIRVWRGPACFAIWISLAGFLRWFRWIQILLGWVLATLFVAGVTGVVRRD